MILELILRRQNFITLFATERTNKPTNMTVLIRDQMIARK